MLKSIEKNIINKTVEEASNFLNNFGMFIQESVIDGKSQICTCDVNNRRVNVEVFSGKIIKVLGIG